MAPQLADGLAQGRVAFLPMQMRAVYDYIAGQAFDMVLLQAAYDRDGRLRLGPNVDFAAAAMAQRACVDRRGERCIRGAGGLPIGCAGAFRRDSPDTSRALTPFGGGAPDATTSRAKLPRHVAALIDDGDCIQTGIGAIPAAILAALADKNDLGLHSGLIDDGGMALIERGVMTGRAKPIDRGMHVTGMALGSAALLDWLATAARRRVSRRGPHARGAA